MSNAYVVNWWALIIRGLAGILLAVAAFFYTPITLAVLLLLFAAYLLVDGAFALVAGIRGRSWWAVVQGVLGIIAGLICWFNPGITAVLLVALTAAWAVLTGALELAVAFALRRIVPGEWMLMVSGALSILFGIVIVLNLAAALVVIVYIIGAYALVAGITYLVLGFRLKGAGGRAFVAST